MGQLRHRVFVGTGFAYRRGLIHSARAPLFLVAPRGTEARS